ncbi:hypothetical protein HCU40_24160 [Pseudanabaena biceps]|nr:hypothetical protein [Pseudanabaena biceps]
MNAKELLESYAAGDRDFSNQSLAGLILTGVNLSGANFIESDLEEITLDIANLEDVELNLANLIRANLSGSILIPSQSQWHNFRASFFDWGQSFSKLCSS